MNAKDACTVYMGLSRESRVSLRMKEKGMGAYDDGI